uniref:Gamma-tubulin complex component n=1 Tax=Phallusia mammillata TaxID=59560 RepID=A0A6F9DWY3_9ASCI|nr:gamma-tubulin complex component 2 [Phallusia mammillata]
MSDEFRIHHCANQLIYLLKASEGQNAAEISDLLLKNRTPFRTTQVNTHTATVRISENAAKPQEFINKYEELKAKNVRNVDSLVYLLSEIMENKEIKDTLVSCADDKGDAAKLIPHHPPGGLGSSLVTLPPSGSKLTAQELIELRSNLEKATITGTGQLTAEAIRKMLHDRHQSRAPNHVVPSPPPWLVGPMKRRHLTYDFPFDTSTQHTGTSLGNQSLRLQEQAVVRDLLAVLSGIEGTHILVRQGDDKYSPRRFILEPTMDVSLAEMVNLVVPIASSYSIVIGFIEERSLFEYGKVNHALCSAMKTIIREYQINLAQLDDHRRRGDLSLQRLVFLLQPVLRQMSVLSSVAIAVERGNCLGGSVLTLLHKRIMGSVGDKVAEQLYTYLAQLANVPYLEMLEKWIYKGEIVDYYSEFLVEEREKFSKDKLLQDYNDQYWESRYTLCRDRIPVYLEQMADKILSTGKYLNVVHECGKTVCFPGAREIVYSPTKKEYVKQIEETHSYASKLLLDLLMNEHNLAARLRSVKSYFLLNESDFLLHFMDLTETEMKMRMQDIMPNRLETLLELALRTSTSERDPYKDDLKIVLLNYDLITQLVRILSIDTVEEKVVKSLDPTELSLSGLESFALDYTVHWPLSLVISRKALTKYQMLFRHLFYCKHVERQLRNVWIRFKSLKRDMAVSHKFGKAMTILQRMLHFILNFEYYMMFEVLEPNWNTLEKNLKTAVNVDEVLDFHTDFLRQSLQDCLLTNTDLLRLLSKLLMLCVAFSNFMQSLSRQVDGPMLEEKLEHMTLSGPPTEDEKRMESDRLLTATRETSTHLEDLTSSEEHLASVSTFERNFSTVLKQLLQDIAFISREQGQHCLFNILHKLDYNGFYQSQIIEEEEGTADSTTATDLISKHHKQPSPTLSKQNS